MGLISDQETGATTDEDLIKGEPELVKNISPSPPPLPPRTLSTSSINPDTLNKAEELLAQGQQAGEEASDNTSSPTSKKQKPRVLPRKSGQLTKSVSLDVAAPMVDRTLKPNIPKPLKSPRRKRQHSHNSLRQMYNRDSQDKTKLQSSLQGTPISEYPFDNLDEDSDSSDFEEFVPPQVSRRKFVSESQMHPTLGSYHFSLDRRGSSPFPSAINSQRESKEILSIKKSSPILTRRPTWFTRKSTSPAIMETSESPYASNRTFPNLDKVERRGKGQQSKASRKKKARSRSLDTQGNMSVSSSGNAYSLLDLHAVTLDSDEGTGGTMDSSGYARPFEHINSWRKLIGMDDGSAFSGSLPHLADNVSSAINNDDDSDTYLDPREIAQRLDKNMPKKVRKRLDTVLSNSTLQGNTYLQLISVYPPQFAEIPVKPPTVTAATPVEPSSSQLLCREAASFKEKWDNRSLDFIERPDSCLSGYTSDNSSTWAADRSDQETEEGELDDGTVNPYDEIKATIDGGAALDNTFDDSMYGRSGLVEVGGEDVYSVIDDDLRTEVSQGRRKKKDSTSSIPPLPKPRVKKAPTLKKQDSGIYARLDEMTNDLPMEVVKDESSDCRRPPTPPPRRPRNISTVTKGSDCDEKRSNNKRYDIPGVSELVAVHLPTVYILIGDVK